MYDKLVQIIGNYLPKKVEEEQVIIDNPEEILNDFRDYYCREAQEAQMLKKENDYYYFFSYIQPAYIVTDAISCIAVEHYRCGVVTDCSYHEDIAVMSDFWGHSDETAREIASPEFNQNFRVYAKDQKTAEDFLSPALRRSFLEAKKCFYGLDVEVKKGKINVSFTCGKYESWQDAILMCNGNAKRKFTDFLGKLR